MRASVRRQPGLCSPWLRSDAVAETLTLIEKTVHLKSSEVFHAIPTEPLAQLAARANELQLDGGQTVFREGDDDQGVFIVIEGVIELRKGDAVVRVLRSGTVHGELFLQESESHQYTAIAREDARVLNLGRNDVFDALLEYPEFGVAMVQDLALRHHKLAERVLELEQQLTASPAARSAERTSVEGIEPPGAGSKPTQTPWLVAAGRTFRSETTCRRIDSLRPSWRPSERQGMCYQERRDLAHVVGHRPACRHLRCADRHQAEGLTAGGPHATHGRGTVCSRCGGADPGLYGLSSAFRRVIRDVSTVRVVFRFSVLVRGLRGYREIPA